MSTPISNNVEGVKASKSPDMTGATHRRGLAALLQPSVSQLKLLSSPRLVLTGLKGGTDGQ